MVNIFTHLVQGKPLTKNSNSTFGIFKSKVVSFQSGCLSLKPQPDGGKGIEREKCQCSD